jgi:hypothetical protein
MTIQNPQVHLRLVFKYLSIVWSHPADYIWVDDRLRSRRRSEDLAANK